MNAWAKAVLFICCVSFIKTQDDQEDVIVEIATGKVKGRWAQTADRQKPYCAFQGIPYAEPPVGDLRFRAPVPAKSWNGLLTTQDDEHRCVQDLYTKGSEDCLYLNVFTPNTESSLPVMVWVYGGSFIQGDSKIENYAPDYFLEKDVIIVTFNYRLGVFGFLSTEDEASPGNYALKDQIMALKWVNKNIQHFGGNPSQITIFGQSAGSAAVSYLLQTPLTKNLFQRAIMQSGTSLNLWSFSRNPKKTAFAIGKALDIVTENTTVLIKELRKIDTKRLNIVSLSTDLVQTVLSNPRDGLIFAPSIEPNVKGAVVTKKSHEMLKQGDFNKVPCIVGFNSQEGIRFKEASGYVRPYFLSYDVFSSRLVPIDMNIDTWWVKIWVGLSIKKTYFGLVPIGLSNKRLTQYITDDQFVRPIHEYVNLLSKHVPVFYYRLSYEGKLGANGKPREISGVSHSEDLYYLWRMEESIDNPSKEDELTRKRMVKLWTNFAKTSNPTPKQVELLQNIIWPVVDKNATYLDIGKDLKLSSNMDEYKIKFWNNLYSHNGVPPFDTF